MLGCTDKVEVLFRFADQLQDRKLSEKLIKVFVNNSGLVKNVYEREIATPVSLLKQISRHKDALHYTANTGLIKPYGKVAVLLPEHDTNIALVKAICSSFLAGNKTIVKLPDMFMHGAPYYQQLFKDHRAEIEFTTGAQTSNEFLHNCLASPEIKAVIITGDDKWLLPLKNLFRRSNTKLIFNGPGKNPQIVLPDAMIDVAVEDAVSSRLINGGQSRFATELFLVHHKVKDEFVAKLITRVSSLKAGPEDAGDEVDIGPVNSNVLLNSMIAQVIEARYKGAKILTGGRPIEINGSGKYIFPPAVITECTSAMRVAQEVNSGPLFPVITFSSENELLSLLDQSGYGLHATIYGTPTDDLTAYMDKNYIHVFFNSMVTHFENSHVQLLDGGFRNSSFTWEWRNGNFIHREGQRTLIKELSYPLT